MLSRSVNACINKLAHRVGTDAEKEARVRLFVQALQLKSEGRSDTEIKWHMRHKTCSGSAAEHITDQASQGG